MSRAKKPMTIGMMTSRLREAERKLRVAELDIQRERKRSADKERLMDAVSASTEALVIIHHGKIVFVQPGVGKPRIWIKSQIHGTFDHRIIEVEL